MERRQLTLLDWAAPLLLVGFVAIGVYDSFRHHYNVHSLEHDAALKAPASFRAQVNASTQFGRAAQWAFSLAYARQAIALHPERASGWINASTAAGALRAWPLSYTYLKKAFALHPSRDLAGNLIYVCGILGKTDEAAALQKRLPQLKNEMRLKEPTQ